MDLRQKIKHILAKLNFSELEIAFYMEVLRSPESSIYEISRKLGIPKNKAYQIYGMLETKGLVSSSSEGRQKQVVANRLDFLAKNMKRQSRNLGKMADSLKEMNRFLPLLNQENNKIEHLKYDEVQERYLDNLDGDFDTLLAYGGFDSFIEAMGYDLEMKFIKKRMRKGKFAKASLVGKDKFTNYLLKNDEDQMRKCRVFTDDQLEKQMKNVFINVLPETNKTVIWNRDANGILEATVIESPQVAKVHEATFNCLWERRREV